MTALRRARAPRTPFRTMLSTLIVTTLVASLTVFVPASAVAAPPTTDEGETFTGIAVEATGGDVLAGGTATVSVNASNATSSALYNASTVVVLPEGVTYAPGSSQPGPPNAVGEPEVRTWAPDPEQPEQTVQVLVWPNIVDLPLGAELDISFGVVADDAVHPVGSTFTVDAGVYANANERIVPRVSIPTDGSAPIVSNASAGGDAAAQVSVSAIELTKVNEDAEAEVYRGPDNATRYALTVTAAEQAGSDSVVVVDRVPAQYQVTDCELGDAFTCATEIVEIEGEVFTQLTWDLGTLPAGETVTLTYEAFVGLQQITAPDGDPDGAATRPGPTGTSVDNTATVSATYTGDVADGTDPEREVTAEATALVLDLGVVKTADRGDFFGGESVDFTLAIRTSQYISTDAVVITDTLPDGLCPVVPAGVETSGTWPADCPQPGEGGTVSGGTMTEAVVNADGTFTLTFAVDGDALAEDQDAQITYTAYMRDDYQNGIPVTTGDTSTNRVEVSGDVSPVGANEVDDGTIESSNGSYATLDTAELSMSKTIWSNPDRQTISAVEGSSATTCETAPAGEYVGSGGPRLQLGDLTCFRIEVDFADGTSTRDPILADFLPLGTELVEWAAGPGNTTEIERLDNDLQWLAGAELDNGSRYVAPGATLVLDLLVRVTDVPDAGADVDITGNLAKLRYLSGTGQVMAARDQVDLTLAPVPPLSLDKAVDGQSRIGVEEGQEVTYTVAVTHEGAPESGDDYALNAVDVWDALPPGFTCDDVTSDVSAPLSCGIAATGPIDGRSLLTWELTGADLGTDELFTPGETLELTYTVRIPSPLSISTSHTNEAAVTRYTAPTTDGTPESAGDITFYPENGFGSPGEKNAPEASDTATVTLGDAVVAKDVVRTGISTGGNNALGQATIGEEVDYLYSVTIPANTSVFEGVLQDGLPLGGRLVANGTPTLTENPGVTVAAGCDADATEFRLCDDGTLLFPDVWTNDSDESVTFGVTLPARVADVTANRHAQNIPNTATFDSASTQDSDPVRRDSDAATVRVVEPQPTLIKTASASNVTGSQEVTYTLTASNGSGRPPLYNAVIVDCVPADLTLGTLPTDLAGPVDGDGSNGCAPGTQRITWELDAPLVSGADRSISYTVTVPAAAPAGEQYTNTADLAGTSTPDEAAGERRTYTSESSRTVDVERPELTKSASTDTLVPGQDITWTVTSTIPANVEMYNAAFVDELPAEFGSSSTSVQSWELSCTDGDTDWQNDCVDGVLLDAVPDTDFGVYIGEITPADEERTLTLTFTTRLPADTTAVQGTTLTNTAEFRWDLADGTAPTATDADWDTSQQATADTQVRHPLVTVAKSVSDATPAQGEEFTYTVRATAVDGARDVPAYDVAVVDTVPSGVVVLDTSGDPLADGASTADGGVWDAPSRTLTWTIATLDPGADSSVTFAYDARLDDAESLSGDALRNSVLPADWASLPTGGREYGPGDEAVAPVTPQFPLIDATKAQVTPANPVYIGQEVTFRIELTNDGGAVASSLDAVDSLPTGWTYVEDSAAVTIPGGEAVATEPTVDGQVLTWSEVGGGSVDLAPGETIVVTYRAVAGSDVEVGMEVAHTNRVTATNVTDSTGGTSFDGGSGSYIGTEGDATARIASADLAISKTANGDFVAGETGTYTITVANDGPDDATGVRVIDEPDLPEGVTLVGASGDGWSCDADGDVSCERSDAGDVLAAGETWELTVSVTIAADVQDGTEIPNTARVTSSTEDRNPDNDEDTDTGIVEALADLTIAKDSDDEVIAGGTIDWSITLTNTGPSLSRGSDDAPIVISDVLPDMVADIDVVSATDGLVCAIEDGTLTCDVPFDLAVGDSVSVQLAGIVDADVEPGFEIENTASVTPVTTDPDGDDNTSTSTTPVAVEESLTVDKSIIAPSEPSDAVPGETITYRIVVANGGPSDARGVTVLDDLPEGITFDSIVDGEERWTAEAVGDDVRFALEGTLPAGEEVSFDILVEIGPGVQGDVTNTVRVSSTWREDQDDSDASIGSRAVADLSILKEIDVTEIVAGADAVATYTLTVDNLGPSDSAGPIDVSDLLPAGVTVAGDLTVGCESADSNGRVRITCEKLDGLDVGEEPWIIEIPVLVDADVTATTLTNVATVAGPTEDSDPSNNTDSTVVPVLQRASLEVSKDAPEIAVAGENVTWTIQVTNTGPSDAQAVTLTDSLDPRLDLVSATSETDGVSCTGESTVVCGLGTIAVGATVTITLVTEVSASVADGAEIPNAATATSTTVDPDTQEPATATDDDTVTVDAQSALTLRKDAETSAVDAGDVATYTLAVGNDGPSDAAAPVRIVDTLPEGQTLLSAGSGAGATAWTCEAAGQVLTCVLEADGEPVSLAAGADAPVLGVAATVSPSQAAGTLTNVATATSPSSEESPSDDADVEVVTRADLELIKSHLADAQATAGESFVWSIEVVNHGPSDSVATVDDPILVRDVLPEGVTLAEEPASIGTDTTCTVAGEDDGRQIVECLRTSTLPAEESLTVALHVEIDESVSGELSNTATVTPGLTPQPADEVHPDTDTDTVPVVEVADLTIAKELVTETLVAGQEATWSVTVTNLGPSDSNASEESPITVVDTLPAGVTDATATGDGWVCESTDPAAGGRAQIECARSETLPVGDAPVITVTATIDSGVRGTLTNDVVVAPGLTAQPDEDPVTDEATVTDPVTESADVAITKAIAETVVAGATGTYRFQIVNLGPSDAREIVVRDALPAGLSFAEIADTTENDGWTCEPDASDGRTVVCSLDEPLEAGDITLLDIVVNADQRLQGDLTNVVTVESSTPDPDLENNDSRVVGVLAERADLAIVKEAMGDAVVGEQFDYTLTVSNKGPSTARGLVISDEVPAQLRVDAVSADGWDCVVVPEDGAPSVVTCLLDELEAGQTAPVATLTVTVLPDAYPAVSNTATVTSSTPEDEASLEDNTSTVTTTIPPLSELVVTKELTRDLEAGFGGEYTITVTNEGPTADPGPITVTDTLPAGLSFRSVTLDGVESDCAADGRVVTCEVGPLEVGQTTTLVMEVDVAESASGTLVNTVTVTSAGDAESPAAEASGEVDRTKLALTGAAPWNILAVALLILLLGGLLLFTRRLENAVPVD
ncbi:MAG: hypothetical protein ACQEW8_07025 [Actinomycetota bacterium]